MVRSRALGWFATLGAVAMTVVDVFALGTGAGGAPPTEVAPASSAPLAASPPNPHVQNPHVQNPHGAMPAMGEGKVLSGSPFLSEAHMQQARLARAGQSFQRASASKADPQLPAGAIGIIVRDGESNPVPNQQLQLRIVHESIERGNTESEAVATTNADGYAAFQQQVAKSSIKYEVVTRKSGAKYSSGPFRLDPRHGQLVTLYVYPSTANINEAFVFTRGLYVVQPRDDVFQIQGLFRFENASPVTWIPEDLQIPMPPGASAFAPGDASGDLRMQAERSSIAITGSFTPGQHEISFSFQLDNPGESTARIRLAPPPHMVDVKLLAEVSPTMTFSVDGMPAATETRGSDGQRALRVVQDFLAAGSGTRPEVFVATITGLPTQGWGAVVAVILAAGIAMFGLTTALSTDRRGRLDEADRDRARQLLLDELVLVEKAFKSKQIGPQTYERTKRSLLDALARIEAATAA